jgi:hypothetical protein
MTGLRDARLHKALESAPDDDMRPAEHVRDEILATAHRAVLPAPAVPWWKTLWEGAGRGNSPWNVAFATLVVAGFVTVLWFDREMPGPRPEAAQAEAPPTAAAGPAASAPPTVVAQATKPGAEPAAPAVRTAPSPATQARKSRADAKPLRDDDPRAFAKTQPPAEAAPPAPLQESAAAGTAAAPRATPLARSAAPVPAPQRDSASGGWTDAKIWAGGREVEVPRSQAGRLAALLGRMERAPPGQEPLDGPVTLKIELSESGALLEVLEVAGAQARWTRERTGRRSVIVLKPEPADLEALRAEAARLAAR